MRDYTCGRKEPQPLDSLAAHRIEAATGVEVRDIVLSYLVYYSGTWNALAGMDVATLDCAEQYGGIVQPFRSDTPPLCAHSDVLLNRWRELNAVQHAGE